MQSVVEMAEPRNRKLAQPFAILNLAGNQDHFLAFGVAGFRYDWQARTVVQINPSGLSCKAKPVSRSDQASARCAAIV